MLPNANIRNDVFLVFYSFKQNIIKTILEKIIRDVAKYRLQISWELVRTQKCIFSKLKQ
jgi:hypothetical protein